MPPKTHETPCAEHEKLAEKFNTLRIIMYACAVIALGVAIYLWQTDDKHDAEISKQAVVIGEINKSLVYIEESQKRLENMLLRRIDYSYSASDSIKLSTDAKALADETFLHGNPLENKKEEN